MLTPRTPRWAIFAAVSGLTRLPLEQIQVDIPAAWIASMTSNTRGTRRVSPPERNTLSTPAAAICSTVRSFSSKPRSGPV